MARARSKKTRGQLRVGDRVTFSLAGRRISGIIVEDRGKIGTGGRRLFAIRARIGTDDDAVLELPAEELSAVAA